ncbi:thrombospondin type 3 repeat-containing protein [Prosthecobacter sp.]|uniref:thrombospondin type 3 repeat-containing protein n=1 Tax=Prosthecobacter sp. TaxID=1965333 RepID=UPI002ABBEA67|nr:thrombospondin type 3 repeat-containing protein [Prosthecobacter sp.]MDZ4405112.1 thrombospondin type 3 repeat-containing protein [Prosthecobacter sp.]
MNTAASTRPGSPVLGILRRFARQAWLLHGCMIATLILLPAQPRLLRADEGTPPEETWSDPVTQTALMAQMSASGGTAYNPGDTKQVDVLLERHIWQVSTSNLGNTVISGYTIEPVSGGQVSFSITSLTGNGFSNMFSASSTTGYDGKCSASVPVDDAPEVVVQAAVTLPNGAESTTSSLNLTKIAPEIWSWSHSEALLSAWLSTPDGTVSSSSTQRTVTVNATYESWDVFTSSFGNTETRNRYSVPAAGANMSWTVTGGDGTFASSSWGQLDGSGSGTIDFTMGAVDSTVRAEIGYINSTAAAATLDFTQPVSTETWTLDHTEGSIATALRVEGDTTAGLGSGTTRQVSADVTFTTWEIWTSSLGNTETRNTTIGPALYAPVSFTVISGDGRWDSPAGAQTVTLATDGNGRASVTFCMGGENAEIEASASYAVSTSSATASFTRPADPVWSQQGTFQELLVNVSATSTTGATVPVTATVNYHVWEVWGNDQDSTTEIRNETTSAALNAPASASVTSGNGTVTSTATATDGAGGFEATYTAASQASVVTVSASFTTDNGTVYGSGSVTIANLDTDGDTYSDEDETADGTDPNNANSKPGTTPPPCSSCGGVGCTVCFDPPVVVDGEYEYEVIDIVTIMKRDEEGFQRGLDVLVARYSYTTIPEEEMEQLRSEFPYAEDSSEQSRRQRGAFSLITTSAKVSITVSTFILGVGAQLGKEVQLISQFIRVLVE